MKTIYILLFSICCCVGSQAQKRINGKFKLLYCEDSKNLYDCTYNYLGKLFQKKLDQNTLEYFLHYKENPDTLTLRVQFVVNEQGKAERKLLNSSFNDLKRANDTIHAILKENLTFIMPLNECSKPVKQSTPALLLQYKVLRSLDKVTIVLIPPLSKEERKQKASKPSDNDYLSAAPKFCKKLKNNRERKACLSKFTKEYIGKNFNTSVINKEGLTCSYRLYTRIRINKKGEVDRVIVSENNYEKIEEEIIRVIMSMPKISPGIKDGKPVGILYSIPIVIQV